MGCNVRKHLEQQWANYNQWAISSYEAFHSCLANLKKYIVIASLKIAVFHNFIYFISIKSLIPWGFKDKSFVLTLLWFIFSLY